MMDNERKAFRLPTTPMANLGGPSPSVGNSTNGGTTVSVADTESKPQYAGYSLADKSERAATLRTIREAYNKAARELSSGDVRGLYFIDSDILMNAPKDFFNKYENTISAAVMQVRNEMSGKDGNADVINDAFNDPLNMNKQKEAYLVVSTRVSNFLSENSNFDGIDNSIIHSMACREILGMGVLDPLWRDERITEIVCNGPFDVQVELGGLMYRVPACRFRDLGVFKNFIDRLYEPVGRHLSPRDPMMKSRMYDKSRIFATHTIMSPEGPNLNIRRHPKGFYTPEKMVSLGAASVEMMTEIGNLVHKGASFLVCGGMGSGKTSMLNALTGFYRDNARIVTLEDNLEMKPNPRKLTAAAMEAVAPSRNSGKDDPGVTLRDLVRAATQMRPDIVIVGETTGAEAFDLCQALNLGHPGASTVHGNNAVDGITRMESLIAQSDELPTTESRLKTIAAAFDFIISVRKYPSDGSRRIYSIDEIGAHPRVTSEGIMTLETKPLWKFRSDGFDENGKVLGDWEKVADISPAKRERRLLDLEPDLTWDQLQALSSIPAELENGV